MRVAIIGGGWAGLSAAVELAAAGIAVTVFEAARQLGGRARSVEVHGHRLDNGQHIFVGAYRETLRLMQRVGADPARLLTRLPLELNFPNTFRMGLPRLPAPLHLAVGLFTARGAGFGEKLSAARFINALKAIDYRLGEDCSVAELLDRHGQHGSLRRHLWEPLCLAALNTAPANASAQIFANALRDSLGGGRVETDLLLPCCDLGRLFPEPAAEFIRGHGGEIRLSTRVDRLDTEGQLRIGGERFDHIILAVAPQHAAALHVPLAGILDGYAFEPIGTAYLGYPETVKLPFPMLGLDTGLGQWVFDRGTLGGMHGVMGFVLSAKGGWDEMDNPALAAALHGELVAALGPLPAPTWHQVIRERRATFSCRPDLARPPAKTAIPGLWLAGDYTYADYPATLEGAVRSGLAAARGVLQA